MLVGLCNLDLHATVAGTWLLPLAMALAVLAAAEMLYLLAGRDIRPNAFLLGGGSLLIVASNAPLQFWPAQFAHCPLGVWGWPGLTFTLLSLGAFLDELRVYRAPGQSVIRLAATILSLFYVGILLSFVVQLRLRGTAPGAGGGVSATGIVALASLVAAVKLCDTGAYTFGRLFGRHKMAPILSPGKTLEGAVGGILLAVLGTWALFAYFEPWLSGGSEHTPWWGAMLYGLIVGLAGMFGDLAESLLKRDTGRKDSSTWLPGFGGVLDLLDSIIFAAPVAYLCWIAGLVH